MSTRRRAARVGRAGSLNRMRTLILIGVMVFSAREASAQAVAVAQFFGGAAIALGAHESGHLLFDTLFGAEPGLKKVNAGPFPFFAITHHPVPAGREFTISSAGFWVQHVSDELILAKHPRLKEEHAPLLKGMLAFNTLTSVGYSGAAFMHRGPVERDTRGMAISARLDEPWIGVSILAPALLDGARYYRPDVRWLKWVSRGAKVGGALMVIRAAS
jgi:hypothetical protein